MHYVEQSTGPCILACTALHWVFYWVSTVHCSDGKGSENSLEETSTGGAHSLQRSPTPQSSRNHPQPKNATPHPGLSLAPRPHLRIRHTSAAVDQAVAGAAAAAAVGGGSFCVGPDPTGSSEAGEGGRQRARCGASNPRLFCCCSYRRRTQDGDRAMCSPTHTVRVLDAQPSLKHRPTKYSQNTAPFHHQMFSKIETKECSKNNNTKN